MTINTSKNTKRKIPKIKIILIVFTVFLLIVVGIFISDPILDEIEKNRFISLDSEMQKLFNDIELSSPESDLWSYSKNCTKEYSGPWPTGDYFCSTIISLDKTITSVDELNEIQNIYYPIIDKSPILKATSELDKELPGDFGVNFVVSTANKDYSEIISGLSCNYSVGLYQREENLTATSDSLGSKIIEPSAKMHLWISCKEKTHNNWYAK